MGPKSNKNIVRARGLDQRSWWIKLRLWQLRRGLHEDCVNWQLTLWSGGDAPLGACSRCYPRMLKLNELLMPRAIIHPVTSHQSLIS
jgi:hypothetical protein